jgi:hypothetical protein
MIIQYLSIMNTCLVDDKKILLIAKIPIEGSEEKIKSGINFYKSYLNFDVVLKANNEPNIWFFGQEIKLANFTDIIEQQPQIEQHQPEKTLKKTLFVDDEKSPEHFELSLESTDVAKTFDEALNLMLKNNYETIYLDHDLGSTITDGSILLNNYMSQNQNKLIKQVYCISNNPVGIERIRLVCKDWNIPYQQVSGQYETIDGQSG